MKSGRGHQRTHRANAINATSSSRPDVARRCLRGRFGGGLALWDIERLCAWLGGRVAGFVTYNLSFLRIFIAQCLFIYHLRGSDGVAEQCFISTTYDATSHFETVAREVEEMYMRITGERLDLDAVTQELGQQ